MKYILISMVCLATVSVAAEKTNYQKLTPDLFAGYSYSLKSNSIIEEYSFNKDGNVAASLGTKNAVTGPILKWKISKEKVLVISDTTINITLVFKTITASKAVTLDGREFIRTKQ